LFTGATLLRASESTRPIDTPCGVPLTVDQIGAPIPGVIDGYHSYYWRDWQQDFDYLISLNPVDTKPNPWGKLLFAGSYFAIYEIAHQQHQVVMTLPDNPQISRNRF